MTPSAKFNSASSNSAPHEAITTCAEDKALHAAPQAPRQCPRLSVVTPSKAFYADTDDEGEEVCLSDLLYVASSSPPASPFQFSIEKEGKSARQSLELLRGADVRRYLLEGDKCYPRTLFNQ